MFGTSAVIIIRVSTHSQDMEPQKKDLEQWARKKGFKKFHFIETTESGFKKIEDRQGLRDLTSFLDRNKDYRTVIITELSRLSRRQSILHSIREYFEDNKIQLLAKDNPPFQLFDSEGNLDPNSSNGFTWLAHFAASETTVKKERFLRARRAYMAQGISISGKLLFGYKRIQGQDGRNRLEPHPENAKHVSSVFQEYLSNNTSIKKIAQESIKSGKPTYLHSKRNINKLLKEQAYIGFKVTSNKRKVLNPITGKTSYTTSSNEIRYPQIISETLFNQVQEKLAKNNFVADKSNKHVSLLSRLIICPKCKNHFIGQYRYKDKVDKSTYRCGSRARAQGCLNSTSISLRILDAAIWSLILTDFETLKKVFLKETPNDELVKKKNEAENVSIEIRKIDEVINEFKMQITRNPKSSLVQTAFIETSKLERKQRAFVNMLDRINIEIQHLEKMTEEIDFLKINEKLNSRFLIKKYIDIFIRSIKLLKHDRRFSVILVEFKTTSNQIAGIIRPDAPDGILEKYCTIVLDKRVTQKVRAFKLNSGVRVSKTQNLIGIPSEVTFTKSSPKIRVNYQDIRLETLTSSRTDILTEMKLVKIPK